MIEKGGATYVYRPEVSSYTCGACVFQKKVPQGERCLFFGPTAPINFKTGSCAYWTHADPKNAFDLPWFSLFTPIQLGYAENANGFSCGRCEEFVPGKNACKKVDRNSAGDTPGQILWNACCALWEKDAKRGNLKDDQLIKILSAKPAPAPPAKTRGTLTALAKAGRL